MIFAEVYLIEKMGDIYNKITDLYSTRIGASKSKCALSLWYGQWGQFQQLHFAQSKGC